MYARAGFGGGVFRTGKEVPVYDGGALPLASAQSLQVAGLSLHRR